MGLSSAPALIWWCDPSPFWDVSTFLPWGALAERNMHCQAGRNHWEAIFVHLVVDPWGNDSWFLWSNQHEKLYPDSLGISVCLWPISKCWWLLGTTMKVGLVIQAQQPQPPFSPCGGIGACGPIKEKQVLKSASGEFFPILQFSGDKFYSRDLFHTIQKYLEPFGIGKALENMSFGRKF